MSEIFNASKERDTTLENATYIHAKLGDINERFINVGSSRISFNIWSFVGNDGRVARRDIFIY